ncbi:MAG: cell wall-binding repeat-containing protein [Firmicutes bacterium]|nr:cell wall-binding repeat-containing protein [Bacillota bacterium]
MKEIKRRLLGLILSVAMLVSGIPFLAAPSYADTKAPFTVSAGSISNEVSTVSYTDWNSAEHTCDLYTVSLPAGTTSLTLSFGSEERIAYTYRDDKKTDYVNHCSANESGYANNGKTGETSAIVRLDNGSFPNYVWVQTPYDDNWTSNDVCAIKLEMAKSSSADVAGMLTATRSKVKSQVKNIYGDEWYVMALARDGQTISEDYFKAVYEEYASNGGAFDGSYTEYAKAILTLTACGYDPRYFGGYDMLKKLEDVNKITAQGVNGSIYALLALDCHNYDSNEFDDVREALLTHIVGSANTSDGLWNYGGGTDTEIDLTALAAMALYKYKDGNTEIAALYNKAVKFLSDTMTENGGYESWGSENANSVACVIWMLTNVGINPLTGSNGSFVKNDKFPMDGLAKFFISGGGFGYTDNKTFNRMATEQAYMALVATDRMLSGKKSFFDMTDVELKPYEPASEDVVMRVDGATRYDTALKAAEVFADGEILDKVIVASGENYPDALSGSFLANLYGAPILLVNSKTEAKVKEFIVEHVYADGEVIILGDKAVVSERFERSLDDGVLEVTRLKGSTRYNTNLEILKRGIKDDHDTNDLFICTGKGYADSLSVSGLGGQILLVGDKLTAEQKTFLKAYTCTGDVYVIGGTDVVKTSVVKEVATALGKSASELEANRLAGATRYKTSLAVAQKFQEQFTQNAMVVYGKNFPDGLAGGPIANQCGAPVLLIAPDNYKDAQTYCRAKQVKAVIVMGSNDLLSSALVRQMFK